MSAPRQLSTDPITSVSSSSASSGSSSTFNTTEAIQIMEKKAAKAKKIWDKSEEIISGPEYRAGVTKIVEDIIAQYQGKPVVVLEILQGGGYMARLICDELKKRGIPYIKTSIVTDSYREGTVAAKEVKLNATPNKISLEGCLVIVAEDVVQTGKSLVVINDYLKTQKVAASKFVVGVDKPYGREPGYEHVKPDYAVLTTDKKGYYAGSGMDFLQFSNYRDEEGVRSADPEWFNPTPPSTPRASDSEGSGNKADNSNNTNNETPRSPSPLRFG